MWSQANQANKSLGCSKTRLNAILLKIYYFLIVTKLQLKNIYYDKILKIKQVSRKKNTLTTKCFSQDRNQSSALDQKKRILSLKKPNSKYLMSRDLFLSFALHQFHEIFALPVCQVLFSNDLESRI